MSDFNGVFLNSLFSLLLKKIVVPTDYHGKVAAVKTMLEDDVSGLADSLTDFSVQTASVDFSVETDNPELTRILKKWLDNINSQYNGQIPRGIKPLAEEYFKERWKSSSFPILKVTKWDIVDGISLPTKMFFVDGESIYAEELDENKKTKELVGYSYSLGKDGEDKLDKGVIITKPYGRWFDEYPNPFLIKRGIYHNWRIIESLKKRESEILEQIIPYLLTIKKGDIALATKDIKTYSQPELAEVKNQFQELMDKMNSIENGTTKSPIRVSQFDEEIKHLIPDLTSIFEPSLFASAEKNILTGLGFIDVVEAVSTSRRESILNPKAFIEETKKGVEDFKAILRELVAQIIENNKDSHKKWMSEKINFYIVSSPVKGFITDDFKTQLRLLWERGQLSDQTYCEMVGEVDFRTEVARREKEAKDGTEITMYPHQTRNQEQFESFEEIKRQKKFDKNGKPISPSKTDDKDKYDIGSYEAPVKCSHCGNVFDLLAEQEAGMGRVKCPQCSGSVTQKDFIKGKKEDLETAPYKTIKDLPSRVKNNLDTDLQSVFMRVFNNAYNLYKNETRAFRVAWSVIRRIGRKGKDGKWLRKSKRVKGKLEKVKLDRAILEQILEKEEKQTIDEAIQLKGLEIKEKQNKLLDKLLKSKDK